MMQCSHYFFTRHLHNIVRGIVKYVNRFKINKLTNIFRQFPKIKLAYFFGSQAAIDLAEAVISIKGLRKPSTMTESFYILAEEGIISAALTEK